MRRVVPWPGVDAPGYVNLHWTSPNPNNPKKPFWRGKPLRDVGSFMGLSAWLLKQSSVKDIYFCLSQQSKAGKNAKGNPIAIREQVNALAVKALWLDLDVKEKAYKTLPEAVADLTKFIASIKLPPPSAMVASGGGLHVYWLTEAVRPEVWQLYANGLRAAALNYGLKCDLGCTIDSARVLRVPGTFNRKVEPQRPVRLLGLQPHDYDLARDFVMLPAVAPVTAAVTSAAPTTFDPALFPKRAAVVESLGEGIKGHIEDPLDWRPVAKECGFVREALTTGGRDYDQPKWNLTTLLATFLEDGHALSHRMGREHPEYTRASTDDLWQRKLRERESKNLGWPSCGAIQTAGCGACGSCPHAGKIKSPLNLTRPKETASPLHNGAVLQGLTVPGAPPITQPELPAGFLYDGDGYICRRIQRDEEDEPTILRIFNCKLWGPWAQKDPWVLNFFATTDKGNFTLVSIPGAEFGISQELSRRLNSMGVMTVPAARRGGHLEDFLVAWTTKLLHELEAQQALPFGWFKQGDTRAGFAFGGVVTNADGTQRPSGFVDEQTRICYTPKGSADVWMKCCKMITDQQRPDLEVLTLISFAAPLMDFVGENSVMICGWGESGTGKTTALGIGTALWGHRTLGNLPAASTENSLMHRMGQLKNLPVYWDDLQEEEHFAAALKTFFAATSGTEKARMRSNITQQVRGTWCNMLGATANKSFVDYVSRKQTHNAGMYRVLEYEVPAAAAGAPGRGDSMEFSRITKLLETNHGQVGMRYATMLATNVDVVDKMIVASAKHFDTHMAPFGNKTTPQAERFWKAGCAAVYTAAKLANQLGCEFHVAEIFRFLCDVWANMRVRVVDENIQVGSRENTEELLTTYLKDRVQQTIWTDKMVMTTGQRALISLLHGPKPDTMRGGIQVRFVTDQQQLVISRPDFVDWLAWKQVPHNAVIKSLKRDWSAQVDKGTIGSGTIYKTSQERLVFVPVPASSALGDMMTNWNTVDMNEEKAA